MSKSGKTIPERIVRVYRRLRHIRSVYIDTCFVGYLTDDAEHKERGDLIVRYLQAYTITPYYSPLVLEELSEIEHELDDDKKLEGMVDRWMHVLEDIGARCLNVTRVSAEEKKFYRFLLNLGLSKNDAIHFTMTVFYDIDAFLSFNKKIFAERKRKIERRLLALKRKTPLVLQVDELYRELQKLDEYSLIS